MDSYSTTHPHSTAQRVDEYQTQSNQKSINVFQNPESSLIDPSLHPHRHSSVLQTHVIHQEINHCFTTIYDSLYVNVVPILYFSTSSKTNLAIHFVLHNFQFFILTIVNFVSDTVPVSILFTSYSFQVKKEVDIIFKQVKGAVDSEVRQ